MFKNLKIRMKIILVQVIFLVSFVILLVFFLVSSGKTNRISTEIQKGYFPYVELNNNLVTTLGDIQKLFQDAVTSSNLDNLSISEEKAAQFLKHIAGAKDSLVIDESEELDADKKLFEEYFSHAKKTTEKMITGDASGNIGEDLKKMVSLYNILKDNLITNTTDSKTKINQAFENQKNNQRSAAIMISLVILISLILVMIVSFVISNGISSSISKGVEFAASISNGDLSLQVHSDQKDEIGELISTLNEMSVKLRNIVTEIKESAVSIAETSAEIKNGAEQVSEGANNQASSLEEVSSSMEQMVSNIQQNMENSKLTEQISGKAAESMKRMGSSAKESLHSIKEIASKITVINDIAFQTNLLALNAAVEAARAGEHGRGFAVVAAEVRKLAEKSKVSADQIMQLSDSSVKVTLESEKLADELMPEIQKTSDLVSGINAASIEQNSGAEQVNNSIQQLNEISQMNASTSEEFASNADGLIIHAEKLKETISFFKL